MEFSELLEKRHSIRDFKDTRIEGPKLRKIVQAAMSAPSAGNIQAYKIYLINSEKAREDMLAATDYQECVRKAAILIVFSADQKRSEAKYLGRGFDLYSIQDATIAASYCQLAATNEGLGVVWVGGFEPLEVSRIVNAKSYEVPVAILALGYPNEEPRATGRRPLKEIVKEI
jgi:nitroreductase